jgi:hypothetical protein
MSLITESFIASIFAGSAIAFLSSIVAMLFKKRRRKAKWAAGASLSMFVLSIVLIFRDLDGDARLKGFLDYADSEAAEKVGITDASIWRLQQQKAEAEKSAAFKARAAEQAAEARAAKEAAASKTRADEEAASVQVRVLAEAKAVKDRAASLETRAALLKPPLEEARFLEAIRRARLQYKNGENDLQRGAARPGRARAICDAVPNAKFENWIGTVERLSTNSDGDGVITIKIADGVQLGTNNNTFSDYNMGTIVKAGSSLYRDLLKMKAGDPVRFSGSFFPRDTDCYVELSMTLRGSIEDPIFIVDFVRIERIELPT